MFTLAETPVCVLVSTLWSRPTAVLKSHNPFCKYTALQPETAPPVHHRPAPDFRRFERMHLKSPVSGQNKARQQKSEKVRTDASVATDGESEDC